MADFAAEMGAPVYLAVEGRFSDPLGDFTAEQWRLFEPDPGRVVTEPPDRELPAGLAALRQAPEPQPYPQPRYVRDPVSGLLVPESLEENPLPGWLGEAERAWQQRGASLDLLEVRVIVRDGQVRGLVLPGPGGPGPLPGLPEAIPTASSSWSLTVPLTRWPVRCAGRARSRVRPCSCRRAEMAGLIRAAEGYAAGMGVVFLVPALAQDAPGVARSRALRPAGRRPARAPGSRPPSRRIRAAAWRRRGGVFGPLRPRLEDA